ncbi:hypothetical protein MHYP_G00118450 [Metynnis hypsauchen]
MLLKERARERRRPRATAHVKEEAAGVPGPGSAPDPQGTWSFLTCSVPEAAGCAAVWIGACVTPLVPHDSCNQKRALLWAILVSGKKRYSMLEKG